MRHAMRAGSTLALCFTLALAVSCRQAKQAEAPPTPAATPAVESAPPAAAPFKVSRIALGRAIDASKKVTQPATAFAPGDTIYATVETEGAAPSVTIAARWTYEDGQLVDDSTQTIAPTGPTATEFHISKPSGWPTGKYKLEVRVDGKSAGTQDFEVRE